MEFIDPSRLGQALLERDGIWQMRLLHCRGFSSFCTAKGCGLLRGNIEVLWRMGLLNADLVRSSRKLHNKGLIPLEMDSDGTRYYADSRVLKRSRKGLVGAASKYRELPKSITPPFHPFRYLVLRNIVLELDLGPALMGILYQEDFLAQDAEKSENYFRKRSSSDEFAEKLNRLNNLASLAIFCEPLSYPKIAGTQHYPAHLGKDWYRSTLKNHKKEAQEVLLGAGEERVEEARKWICMEAYRLDQNTSLLTLIRQLGGKVRQDLRGNLGGSVHLYSMAESIRRASEKTFDKEFPEEDEIGSGWSPSTYKKHFYGSSRLADGKKKVRKAYLRQQKLDHSLHLRWYCEGGTEWGALGEIFDSLAPTTAEVINLAGQVIERRRKGVAFRESLRRDINQEVFSFVSLDGDRSDNIRAIQTAARNDEFFGRFFIYDPDFELANFRWAELKKVIVLIAERREASAAQLEQLRAALDSSELSVPGLHRTARATLPELLGDLQKGPEWGKWLMRFAWRTPKKDDGDKRQIIGAVEEGIRCCKGYNYRRSREDFRVDPDMGRLIKKQE